MKYYKLISNNEFIGIGTSFDMRKFQKNMAFSWCVMSLKLNTFNAMGKCIVQYGWHLKILMHKMFLSLM